MWVLGTTGVTSNLTRLLVGPRSFLAHTLGCGGQHVSSLGALCSWYMVAAHSWLLHTQIKSYNYAKPGFNGTTAAFT